MKKRLTPLIAAAALAALALGTNTFAQESEDPAPSEPGVPYVDPDPNVLVESGVPEVIVTSGGDFDPTILTKFISGAGMVEDQGAGAFADVSSRPLNQGCVSPGTGSGGDLTTLSGSVELPDGARIKRVIFYGQDSDAGFNINVRLIRTQITIPLIGAVTRADQVVSSFNTGGLSGVMSVAGADNLNELTGTPFTGGLLLSFPHRFHTVKVDLRNVSGANHVLCGVEVQYQVPAGSVEAPTFASDPGTTFYPIDPIRAYDGRVAAYPESGMLAPNTSKTISIKDSHDGAGAVIAADVVPPEATAIAYNLTIAEATANNFVAVTPGGAAGFTTSAINFNGTSDIANAGTVSINANREITVWGGDQPGSMFVLIDVTGYYAPPPALTAPVVEFPNMGN